MGRVMRVKCRQEADFFPRFFTAARQRAVPIYPEPMVKVTGDPISRAVLRYLGIDPSSESREAQEDKGIVIIVHGPPLAGV